MRQLLASGAALLVPFTAAAQYEDDGVPPPPPQGEDGHSSPQAPPPWPAWRVRSLRLPTPACPHGEDGGEDGSSSTRLAKIDIFGVVHHQLHVARQCARFIRAARPDVLVVEQDEAGLRRRVDAYYKLLKPGQRALTDMWRGAHFPGIDSMRLMRHRFAHGFDAVAAEDFLAFRALEEAGLDLSEAVVAGDLPRRKLGPIYASTAGAAKAEERWLDLNEARNPSVRRAYSYAEQTLAEYDAIHGGGRGGGGGGGGAGTASTEEREADLERRRQHYNSFFDVPDDVDYEGRFPRPPVTAAREAHLAKTAFREARATKQGANERGRKHVVMVVGADHCDGIARVLEKLAREEAAIAAAGAATPRAAVAAAGEEEEMQQENSPDRP